MTYEEFRANYGRYQAPWWRQFLQCLPGYHYAFSRDAREWRWFNWYRLALILRIRVPNATGWYGNVPEAKDASWCWPWQFYRRYYAVRFPND